MKRTAAILALALTGCALHAQAVDIKPTPASDALNKAAQDLERTQHSIDSLLQQARTTMEQNRLRSIYDKTGMGDRLELALFVISSPALKAACEYAVTQLEQML